MSSTTREVGTATIPMPGTHPAVIRENREHHRRQVDQELWLTDMSGENVLNCRCRNLSAGGLHATAPVGFGLAVGQRYQLRLAAGTGHGGSLLFGDSLGYATVIRTHLKLDDDEESVDFAARFDSPQYLPI
jgi:hypothetical protein